MICWQERHQIFFHSHATYVFLDPFWKFIFKKKKTKRKQKTVNLINSLLLCNPLCTSHCFHLYSLISSSYSVTCQMWMSVRRECVQRSVWTLQGVSVVTAMVIRAWSWARTSGAVRWNTLILANIIHPFHSPDFTLVVKCELYSRYFKQFWKSQLAACIVLMTVARCVICLFSFSL